MKLSTLVTTLTLSLALMTTAKLRATDFIHFDTPLYKYRVYLTDKKGTPYSVKRPEQFLSQKSIERRKRLKLKVDKHDLPLTPAYVDGIRAKGLRVVNKSKWNNTLVVETTDSTLAQSLTTLPYVKSVRRVYTRPDSIAAPDTTDRHSRLTGKLDSTANYYGHGYGQIEMLNGLRLHDAGLRGQGMTIAVIDGGFYNADILPGLKGTRILGTRNFVNDDPDVYAAHWHGMAVLSCIGARAPYSLVGTAPEASFYLLMSEDTPTEHMVEEDNWCAAVEYADSLVWTSLPARSAITPTTTRLKATPIVNSTAVPPSTAARLRSPPAAASWCSTAPAMQATTDGKRSACQPTRPTSSP